MTFHFHHRVYPFKVPGGTSRGILKEKQSWILEFEHAGIVGVGECSVIPGLSPDYINQEDYFQRLLHLKVLFPAQTEIEEKIKFSNQLESRWSEDLMEFLKLNPSIRFGLESALLDWSNGGRRVYFHNGFAEGEIKIPINGLIWMGSKDSMLEQIAKKKSENFSCIKIKIGAISQNEELEVIEYMREVFPANTILRLDANGAFSLEQAIDYFEKLKRFNIHSVEQPLGKGNWFDLKKLIDKNILAVALDEELIGVSDSKEMGELLDSLNPSYIVLKPSLHGGLEGCKSWIEEAEKRKIAWWMTSALESNVGLDVLAQFTAQYDNPVHHGLGTGALYEWNEKSDLVVHAGHLYRDIK